VKGSELLPLLPELMRAGLRRASTPLRVLWRRGWIYRRLLKGPLADHIVFHPWDALPRRLEEADSLLRGRFRFYGQTVDVPAGVSVFDVKPPSAAWHEALHSFNWLPALSTAGGEASRKLATNLIGQWIKRHQLYSEPVWLPHIMARRLAHIFSHGRLVILNSEMMWRSRLFVSLREQSRMLERIWKPAPCWRCPACAWMTAPSAVIPDWRGWKRRSSARYCPTAAMFRAHPKRCCRPIAMSSW
jgi:uncharacterized heparinase superfamily protein